MCDNKFIITSTGNGNAVLKFYNRSSKFLSMKLKKKDLDKLIDAINKIIEYTYTIKTGVYNKMEFCIGTKSISFFCKHKKIKNRMALYSFKEEYNEFIDDIRCNLGNLNTLNMTFLFKSSFNFVSYLGDSFKSILRSTTIFPKKIDVDQLTSFDVNEIEHDGNKYCLLACIEDGILYGFVFNEDKKMITGIMSEYDNSSIYHFIKIPSYSSELTSELKAKIKKYADEVLP